MKKLSYIIDALLILIIGLLGYVQISMMVSKGSNYGVPKVFGQSILYVATDSMDDPDNPDSLSPGTGILISEASPKDIKVSTPIYDEESGEVIDYEKDGDIVTFYYDKIKAPDTHRVVEKEYRQEEGKYYFLTMGDNPLAHERQLKEEWSEDYLIGKVTYHSKALGGFLEISSPDAAAYASARTGENKSAWFFPVAIITPLVLIAGMSIFDVIRKYIKEKKIRDEEITKALEASGIDLNDEEACTLFRMKEEMRLDIKEEMEKQYQAMKKKALKEMQKKKEQNEEI